MQKIKIICSDLDGTLLDDDKHVSQQNIEAIKKWQQAGGLFGVTSGRQMSGIDLVIKDIIKPDFIVSLNGARVYKISDEKVWNRMSTQNVKNVLKVMQRFPVDKIVLTHAGVTEEFDENSVTINQEIEKVASIVKNENVLHSLIKDLEKLPVTTSWSDKNYVEVSEQGVSKYSGLKQALEGIYNTEQVAAMGDFGNDIEIVSKVGCGVAVANATPELKRVAKLIVTDNNNSAVADLITRLMIEGD